MQGETGYVAGGRIKLANPPPTGIDRHSLVVDSPGGSTLCRLHAEWKISMISTAFTESMSSAEGSSPP